MDANSTVNGKEEERGYVYSSSGWGGGGIKETKRVRAGKPEGATSIEYWWVRQCLVILAVVQKRECMKVEHGVGL